MRTIVCALILALPLTATADPARFQQDRFVISFFVDPPLDERAEEHYRDIAAANFNVVLGGFSARSPETIAQQLALCEQFNLKAIVAPTEAPETGLADGPACWGYIVRDEPSAKDFPDLRARVDAIRESRPGKLALINLFPSYCEPERLGTPTYDEHVRLYMEQVRPDVLCMDHYPFMTPTKDTRDAYLEDLATMRTHSQANGVPFWNFFNTMPFGPHYDPTEAQIRWQVFASVAYGAKGVLYFCYYTPQGAEFPRGGAILTVDGRKTAHYEHARRTNRILRSWGPTLMRLSSTAVHRIVGGEAFTAPEGCPVTSASEGEFLVGAFDAGENARAVLLLNHDTAFTAWPTLTFDADPANILEVSPQDGATRPLIDDSPATDGLQLSFESGGARLFLLPPAATAE